MPQRWGKVAVSAGAERITVDEAGVDEETVVIAMLQEDTQDIHVRAVTTRQGKITILFSKKLPKRTIVAYLINTEVV